MSIRFITLLCYYERFGHMFIAPTKVTLCQFQDSRQSKPLFPEIVLSERTQTAYKYRFFD